MGALDELRAGGFSEDEISTFASDKAQALRAGGFGDQEISDYLGVKPPAPPDMAGANRSFSRVVGNALGTAAKVLKPSLDTTLDITSVYAPIEAALNVGTGLLFGFPAYVGGAGGGLIDKYALGMDVDPKELAETISKAVTYQPVTERGRRLTGNVMLPFDWLQQGAEKAGHSAVDAALYAGASSNTAAALGAVTDATVNMLPPVLFGALARKMGGQRIGSDDMANAAKVAAGDGATPQAVAAAEASLRATYDQTGIDPYSVLEEGRREPSIMSDLVDPDVGVPRALEPYVERPGPVEVRPGDGLPLLDVGEPGPTLAEQAQQQFAQEIKERAPEVQGVAQLDRPPAQALAAAGLEDTPANRVDVALVARAEELDPPAFYQAAIAHGEDEAAFMASVKEIIRNGEQNAQARGGGLGAEPVEAGNATGAGQPAEAGGQPELYPGGTVELHSGLSAESAIRNLAGSYTPFVGVEQRPAGARPANVASPEYSPSPMGDALRKVFAPASRGPLAQKMAGIVRANFGEMARGQEVALERLTESAARFDKLPFDENISFIDSMERGTKIEDPQAAAAAQDLRTLLDAKRDEVQELGKGQLENFDANYFPHIWMEQDEAAMLFTRRPLEGSKAFLKERTIPYTVDGLRWRAYDAEGDFIKSFDTEAEARRAMPEGGRIGAPLTPITSNPVELALLKAREMDRYIYGQRIFQEMKDTGLARFVRFGERAPLGWTKIDDKIARVWQYSEAESGSILRGEYYAPDEAATLINNHLSPGLRGNAFYDAWRGIGMALNSAQLGLSLFHVGFTTMDTMISKVALGVKQIGRGDILPGAADVMQGLNPVQPFLNIYKGDRLLRAYLGKLDDPAMAPIVDAIEQAGGRVRMDDFYRNTTVNAFKQAVRRGDVWGATKAFLPTVLDRISAPIFEQLVPRQKLGVFFDMAKDWLAKNPDASVETKRAELGKLWDSVDNRMGQLVYDNVFWDRALKDGLMATVRSVGWNLGTFRELGGGVLDVKDVIRSKGISDRTAYVIALPLVTAIYGSILNYAYTGKMPETMKDAFYPRTGRLRPDGSEDRVSLPTYMKDVFAYGEDIKNWAAYGTDPTQTLKNKTHPLISTVSEMLNNQDFFGAAIRNPAAPVVNQIADEAGFLAQQFSPFSFRNYMQQAKTRGEEPSVLGYLTSPSMVGITPAPGYMVKSAEELESGQVSRLHDSLMKKFMQELKGGADQDKIIDEMIGAGMTKHDIRHAIASSGETPLPHRLKHFGTEQRP